MKWLMIRAYCTHGESVFVVLLLLIVNLISNKNEVCELMKLMGVLSSMDMGRYHFHPCFTKHLFVATKMVAMV